MKFVVKWVEFWDAEIEAETPEEAIAVAQKRLCNSPNAELYGWGGLQDKLGRYGPLTINDSVDFHQFLFYVGCQLLRFKNRIGSNNQIELFIKKFLENHIVSEINFLSI